VRNQKKNGTTKQRARRDWIDTVLLKKTKKQNKNTRDVSGREQQNVIKVRLTPL
jgi:hypothetical protein